VTALALGSHAWGVFVGILLVGGALLGLKAWRKP
jgi:hypothetical protein